MRKQLYILFLLPVMVHAKDLGVHGEIFEIQEPDLLSVIEGKLEALESTGQLEKQNQKIRAQTESRLQRPKPVTGLKKTQTPKQYTYDPTLILSSDLKDHKNRVFARKGQKINPLEFVTLRHALLFFDGDDPEQCAWARKQKGTPQWILTNGAPIQLGKQEHRPVYFDQASILTKKFGIHQVPCRVSQKGHFLLIEEELVL